MAEGAKKTRALPSFESHERSTVNKKLARLVSRLVKHEDVPNGYCVFVGAFDESARGVRLFLPEEIEDIEILRVELGNAVESVLSKYVGKKRKHSVVNAAGSHGGRRGDDEDRESGGEGSGSDGGDDEPAITDSLIKDALQAIVGACLKLRIPQKSERPPGPGGTQKGIKKKDYRLLDKSGKKVLIENDYTLADVRGAWPDWWPDGVWFLKPSLLTRDELLSVLPAVMKSMMDDNMFSIDTVFERVRKAYGRTWKWPYDVPSKRLLQVLHRLLEEEGSDPKNLVRVTTGTKGKQRDLWLMLRGVEDDYQGIDELLPKPADVKVFWGVDRHDPDGDGDRDDIVHLENCTAETLREKVKERAQRLAPLVEEEPEEEPAAKRPRGQSRGGGGKNPKKPPPPKKKPEKAAKEKENPKKKNAKAKAK